MKLAFICNQNQARSQVLSAVFPTIISSLEVSSFGLIAREETPLPLVIESIFQDWGLDSDGRFARNLRLHWEELMEMDLVVTVTSLIAEEVKALGFRGEIIDLEREASRLGIDVVDPQLMPRRQCAFELAKYLKIAVSAFQGIGLLKHGSQILALVPEDERAVEKAVEIALQKVATDTTLLFGDLIAPGKALPPLNEPNILHFKVDEKTSLIKIQGSSQEARIYLPKSASMRPSRVYLSRSWQDFVFQMLTKSLTIVTPPARNATGKIPDSYLAALYADKVEVIQS